MDDVRYVNSNGDSITLSPPDFILQDGETLHDWKVTREALNGRTVTVSKGESEKKFSIAILSNDNGLALRDALYDIAAIDIEASKPGRLYVGDWYMTGYIKETELSMHRFKDMMALYAYTFMSDSPYWTREHVFPISGTIAMTDLDFPFNYPHDYGGPRGVAQIANPDIVPSQFKLVMIGAASNPSVTIGGNTYRIDINLGAGEQVVIDSLSDGTRKTITKRTVGGVETNAFHLRHGTQRKGSGSYTFEPIPVGTSPVSWNGEFSMELTIYERRLQRRWA